MKFTRFLQYLGISLCLGCTVGLIFSIIFTLLLPIQVYQAYFIILFFASAGATGLFTLNKLTPKQKPPQTEVTNEPT
jgi:uncharacterized membrane protein YgaE (UPF0421/DUF939 family)